MRASIGRGAEATISRAPQDIVIPEQSHRNGSVGDIGAFDNRIPHVTQRRTADEPCHSCLPC